MVSSRRQRCARHSWQLLALRLALLAGVVGSAPALARPNIILITVDCLRPDHLGYYGYARDTSPSLDALSREGVFFRQAFSTSGWTAPGLISIQTSLHAPSHGVDIRGKSMDPDVVTLAEALGQAGYRTPDILFLTDIPNFHHLGLESYARKARYVRQADEILFRWLAEEAHTSDAPFFLYYHYRDVHQPYQLSPEHDLYTRASFGRPYSPLSLLKRVIAKEKMELVTREIHLPRGVMDFAAWDRPWVEALYDGQIRRLDDDIFARLRRVLHQQSLEDSTLIIVSADHGEELLEDGLIGHVSTYREGRLNDRVIRIPLILWYPGVLPAGLVIEDPVQCIDVMPTILELAGAGVPPGAQGRSLVPLVRDGSAAWPRRPVFCETSDGGYTASLEQYARRVRAVRTERWKLVHFSPEDRSELYDLMADPEERADVHQEHPEVADSLQSLLDRWVTGTRRRSSVEAAPPGPRRGGEPQSGASDRREAPRILYPQDGDTLGYVGTDQVIRLSWTGREDVPYTIQYEVGRGTYYLEGELRVPGNSPEYGPYHASFWNALVLYNPWRFRVYRADGTGARSEWVSFSLGPVGGEARALTFALAALEAKQAVADALQAGVDLVRGLGLGLLDLYVWVARVPAADLSAWALIAAIVGAALWPQVQRLGEDRCRNWGAAFAYIALVYATVPVFPAVWDRLWVHTEGAIRHLGILVILGLAVAVLTAVRHRVGRRDWVPYAVLVAVFAAYGYLLAVFGTYPAERLHLIEYGLLGWMLFRALRLDLSGGRAYVVALVLTVLVGVGDESIQWILPQRFFEVKDVVLNAVSGVLGLLTVRFSLYGGWEPGSALAEER